MKLKTIVKYNDSPPCSGPYSLAVQATGKCLFVAGHGPWNPKAKQFERGTIGEQTRLTLEGIKRTIEAAGGKIENAVSCRVYLQPLTAATFADMNEVYQRYWPQARPARATVGAQLLGIDVEIECVVVMD